MDILKFLTEDIANEGMLQNIKDGVSRLTDRAPGYRNTINKNFEKKEDYKNLDIKDLIKLEVSDDNYKELQKKYPKVKIMKPHGLYYTENVQFLNPAGTETVCLIAYYYDQILNRKWLDNFKIYKKYQGCGLSSKFLKFITETLKCNMLWVLDKGELAKSVYLKNGWKPVPKEDVYYQEKGGTVMYHGNFKVVTTEEADEIERKKNLETVKESFDIISLLSNESTIADEALVKNDSKSLKEKISDARNILSNYKRNEINSETMKRIKSSNNISNLNHLKTDETTKGYIYTDTNTVVCAINTEKKDDGVVWIQGIEIFKGYKGNGLSYGLLDIAVKELKATHLSVRKTNKVAIDLYLKFGFKIYQDIGFMYFMKK